MHLGIVAEGPSDLILLESIAKRLQPNCSVTRIQPEATLGKRGSGWKAVRAWCQEFGQELELIMEADSENPIDRLLIHVDCSMAHNVNAKRPCPPSSDTASELRSVILKSWLSMKRKPSWLHIATPSSSSDTWLVGVLAPLKSKTPLECIDQAVIEGHLASEKLFRKRTDGRLAKPGRLYEQLALRVVERLPDLRASCDLADALCQELS